MRNGEITPLTIAHFISELYARQAQKYGGETSLNELRTIAHCYLVYSKGEDGTSVTELSRELGIPTSTTHRAVTQLIEKGWLTDSPHPEDRRRRVVRLSEQGVSGGLWQEAIAWLDRYSE